MKSVGPMQRAFELLLGNGFRYTWLDRAPQRTKQKELEKQALDYQWKCNGRRCQIYDPSSGVDILLSKTFDSRVLVKGSADPRIVWVRLDGPVCPLFVICVYVPYKFKKNSPFAEEVLTQLESLLVNCKKIRPMDCVIIMGDLNCELQHNVSGCTGKWLMNERPDNGHGLRVLDSW